MKNKIGFLFFIMLLPLLISFEAPKNKTTNVFVFEIKDDIGPPTWRITKEAFEQAILQEADVIFLILNTYGGLVDAADSIRTKILASNIPVFVLIENNAASAGALISISCDSIYMQPGSTIGAATVVNQSGEQVPDKYQSYMRKKMRATAEEKGRNPDIAEAMVDPDKVVEGISEKGKVVTFTTQEALKHGFCNGVAKNFEEALSLAKITNYTITNYKPSTIDKIINWLIDPVISGLLIMIIIGGIYFELQTPGIGFPIGAAAVAAILYFAPLYLEGLAANWEIIIFIVGIVLLLVEIFAIPGFGIFGITGIVFIVFGLGLSMLGNNGFDFTGINPGAITQALLIVIISTFLAIAGSIGLGAKLLTSNLFSQFILKTEQRKDQGYISSGRMGEQNFIGQNALTLTPLMPLGKIELNNEIYEASAQSGYIEKGQKVIIERFEGNHFVVKTTS